MFSCGHLYQVKFTYVVLRSSVLCCVHLCCAAFSCVGLHSPVLGCVQLCCAAFTCVRLRSPVLSCVYLRWATLTWVRRCVTIILTILTLTADQSLRGCWLNSMPVLQVAAARPEVDESHERSSAQVVCF